MSGARNVHEFGVRVSRKESEVSTRAVLEPSESVALAERLLTAGSCPTELQAQGPLTPSPTLERLVRLFQMGREGTIAKLGHCRLSPRADRRSERLPLMM
jgi:hypothetical protein